MLFHAAAAVHYGGECVYSMLSEPERAVAAEYPPIDFGGLMFGTESVDSALDLVAHIIQEALTPVFLLSGIATLLNVFSTRLARVADQVAAVGKALNDADPAGQAILTRQLTTLFRRSVALDAAVVLAALGAAATCGAVLALFVSSFREKANAWVLFGLFAAAVVCALGGIVAFAVEMLMAGIGIRREVAATRRARDDDPAEADAHPHEAGPSDGPASGDAGG
jgi:hypothetical protein